MSSHTQVQQVQFGGRRRLMLCTFAGLFALLFARAFYLQVVHVDFLQSQSSFVKKIHETAHRGRILDRYGEVLAVSTPLHTVKARRRDFDSENDEKVAQLAAALNMSVEVLRKRTKGTRGEVNLRRQLTPYEVAAVKRLDMPGIILEPEYRRYYPAGEVAAHLVGFTNVDDRGQVGLERVFDDMLTGHEADRRVIQLPSSTKAQWRVVEDIDHGRQANSGEDLTLTIDQRLQYIAYRELKEAVRKHGAKAGSVVMLDAHNGEILAMANQPSYNPNLRASRKPEHYRNRAVTDLFEPGSTVKPFAVYCALEKGAQFDSESVIDTSPGYYRMGGHLVRDHRNYGLINVSQVLQKSSNVGAIKMAMSVSQEDFWGCYDQVGFGQVSLSGLPGEVQGRFDWHQDWHGLEQQSLAFGYGMSTSALQLARAYLPLANGGMMPQVSIVKGMDKEPPQRVMNAVTADTIRAMLEKVVTREGTAFRAAVNNYRVAGKTGTAHVAAEGGYAEHRYISLFAGMAPASNPRWVMVVTIHEPSGEEYYGGAVAAPVFSSVMQEALRLWGVPPDQWEFAEPVIRMAEGSLQ